MGMSRTVGMYGAALAMAMSFGCSDATDPLQPPIEKDAGGQKYPTLPASCDDMSSVTSTGQGASTDLLHRNQRLRVTDRTVYYHRAAGIHAIEVPGGAGALQLLYPEATVSTGKRPLRFRDFWLNSTSVLGAIGGALYEGALSGEVATLRPGYSAPSYDALVEDQGYYAAGGGAVFRTARTSSSTTVIERLPVTSGPGAVFLQLRRDKQGRIFIADNFLYYVDWADGESGETASIFTTPLDGAAPSPVATGLQSPELLGFYGSALYFQDSSVQLGQLWRVRAGEAAEKLTIPDYTSLGITADDTRLAGLGSSVYLTGRALYQLPDAGTSLRDVVLRVGTGSPSAEVVQCLPNTAAESEVLPSDYAIWNIDLAAGDSALYLSRVFLNAKRQTWEERISEVRP
jgi:hypothetical protein